MELARYTIIIAAAVCLLVALVPLRRLLAGLPAGALRRSWLLMGGLVLVMIGAELLYSFDLPMLSGLPRELMMPIGLLAAGWFVALNTHLSVKSVHDLQRLNQLEQQSITDELTGLFNRRHFNTRLREEVERSRRHRTPLSLLLIDADHFKAVNDTYGHQVGDRALQHLAELIAQESRHCDVLARYGGEELVLIAPNASREQARWQAERLRRHVQANPLVLESGVEVPLTISVGAAQLDCTDSSCASALVRRVDQALYAAKSQGRNRVVVATGVTREQKIASLRERIAERREQARAA